MAGDPNNQVWLTSALTDDDVTKALTLCFSLKRGLTNRKVGVIASQTISLSLKEALHRGFDLFFYLDEDRNTAGLKCEDFAKLFALTVKGFRKCVYLEPSMLAIQNCDEIFETGRDQQETFIFTQKEGNMSILLLRPSMLTFEVLMDCFTEVKEAEVEKYLRNWTKNQAGVVNKLHEKYYRVISPGTSFYPGNQCDVSMVNVIDIPTNYNTKDNGIFAQLVLEQRTQIFEGMVQPILQSKSSATLPKSKFFHQNLDNKEPIAIVGMSCRYPGANNLEEFWNLLFNGEDGTGTPPEFRWRHGSTVTTDCRKTNAGFLKTPVDEFDAKFFGISPKEMLFLDPQHRLLHELVWEGLEDAAINPQSMRGKPGGVFIGSWTNEYRDILRAGTDEFFRMYMGNSIGAAAARISHMLDLTGPSLATESGCSSAMVAVHLAVKSLQRGESSFALACGVNLLLTSFDKNLMPMVLSPDGHCKTFDADADGFARAEGGGVLVLKRVSDAVKDGDNIWALIKGSGITQEGISKSMGTPTVHCESMAMKLALEDADIEAERVSFVEAHGTGTSVGDPMEIAAIAKAYHSKNRKEPLIIGSVKTNVGHTESCSGITGITKVVLALQNEVIPAHRNFSTLNPLIDLEAVPAKLPLAPVPWQRQEGQPRVAGVSSFGITGTDAHLILEESPTIAGNNLTIALPLERSYHVMKISARTDEALNILLENYKGLLTSSQDPFSDLSHTANVGRADFNQRAVIIAKSNEEAVQFIEKKKFLRGEESVGNVGKVCFLFTGQGSQYPGMAKQLYNTSPVFRMHFEYCANVLKNQYNIDIVHVLWSNKENSNEISRTIYSQTSIFCVEYALLKLWQSWGVEPDFVLGHSLGEFAAVVCAGIISVEDALKLVAERSRLIELLPNGKMLVIKAELQRVNILMKEFGSILDIAAINSNDQTVVAGDADVVLNFFEFCKGVEVKCIVLDSSHAFHSKHMDPILKDYEFVAKCVEQLPGSNCKYISGLRGCLVDKESLDADYWVCHTREKVNFLDASKAAVDLGIKVFIEIGPQPILSALTMMNNNSPVLCLPSLKKNQCEWETLLNTVGTLYIKGMQIDWKGLDQYCKRNKCKLPIYPFIGRQHWPEFVAPTGVKLHPLLGSVIPNASSATLFQSSLSLKDFEYVKDHAIGENIIFPGAGFLEMCLAAGHATVEATTDSLAFPTRAIKVENLFIQAPLSIKEDKSCNIQTVVELNTTNHNGSEWNDMKVKIFRKLEQENNKWFPHAQATFSPIPSVDERNIPFDSKIFTETLEQPSNENEANEVYNKLANIGLKFGPTFRSIEKIWRNNSNSLLAHVKVPPQEDGGTPYIIHPVVLDAMIQAIMMLRVSSSMRKKLYVPIKIGTFVWLGKTYSSGNVIYVHASTSANDEDTSTAILLDTSGSPLAIMSNVEFIDTTVKAIESVLDQQTSSMPDMYEEVWRPKMGALQFPMQIEKISGQFYSDEFRKLNDEINLHPPAHLCEIFRELEIFVYWNMLRGLYECGWNPPQLQELFAESEVFKNLGIAEKHRQYFGFIMGVLEQEGIIRRATTTEDSRTDVAWEIIQTPASKAEIMVLLNSSMVSNLTSKFKSTRLFGKVGECLGTILKGEMSGLTVLFPPEKTDYPSAGNFYTEYGDLFKVEAVVDLVVSKWLETLKEKTNDEKNVLRVLEVGAGTGSLTGTLIRNFELHGINFELTYTDISAAFFVAAEKKFEKHAKQIIYRKLNIEEDPLDQGFAPEYYDFVFTADVIHATKNIQQSLQNIRMIMKPFAKLGILEMTRVLRLGTFSFGLLDGFWRFEDRELRKSHCTLSKSDWSRVLAENGFQVNGIFSAMKDSHSFICSERTQPPVCYYMDSKLKRNNKTWLLFHHDASSVSVSKYIQDKIRATTTRNIIMVNAGNEFEEITIDESWTNFYIRKSEEEDFDQMVKSIHQKHLVIEGIVYCWALNQNQTSQVDILKPFFYISKTIMNTKQVITPRFYTITSGVVPLEENDMSHFYASTLWGFSKSLKNENHAINGRCIEVADGRWDQTRLQEIFLEIWNLEKDLMVAFTGNSRFVPKLQIHKPSNRALSLPKGTDRFQLILPETRAISDLQFGTLNTVNLKESEVEVQIKASALNFRDILSILKPSDDFKNVNTVGFDFAGLIKKVGSKVTKWNVGDRVCGCNVHFTAMPSHIALHEELLLQIPGNLSYSEGATMPAVYITSVLCLLRVAKIKKGDIVLVHTASGGVGLSAIEICKHVDCTIIATAGSKRKQNYLRSLGIQHVFHSRNTEYGKQILAVTDGKGVDVVLNSLTGEGFKEATLNACAEGARFVEMSKLNIWTTSEVKTLRPDIKYVAVDISQSNTEEWTNLLNELKPLLENKIAKPIPHVKFDALNVREALQYMQKAKHVGKIVCVLPEFKHENGETTIHTPMFDDVSTYLITGGLGGIGFVVCQWMVARGAKHVILAGRRSPSSTIKNGIIDMNLNGCNIIPVCLDVGDFEQCSKLIRTKIPSMGIPPLKGIMHAAGTLADGLISNQDWETLSSTFKTKIDGTLNMHDLTRDYNLEHFVLFSSMAAILGTPGQCNHSAANSFEDAFAHYRHSIGLPATTINWGQWGEVGIATEVDLPGLKTLSTLQGITGLEYVMKTQRTQTAILNVTSFMIMEKFYPHLSSYLDERIWKKSNAGATDSLAIKSNEFWQQYDSVTNVEEKIGVLKTHLKSILRIILKLEDNEFIADDVDMQEMGVDSLMFVEIKNCLQTLLCDRLTVSVNSLRGCNTVNQISTTIVEQIEGAYQQVETKPTMEEVNQLILEDSALPQHIKATPTQKPVELSDIKTILITGASGTLGPYILKQLTSLPQITQVVCLLRPTKKLTLKERLVNVLLNSSILQHVDLEKIHCVSGNVAEPRLGMDVENWEELSEKVDAVFHCAACVQHTEHYKKRNSRKDSRAVNVGGIRNILEFSCEKKLKHVFHASSLLAVPTIDNGRVSERWPEMGEYDGITTFAYPVSKFVGDILLKQAVERGIPCKVFRFPLIVGESETGRCVIENNHALLRYMFIMKNGVIPSTPFILSMLPVDVCADVSVRIFFEEKSESGIYNVTHGHPSMDQEFVGIARKFGYNVEIVDFADFSKRVQESDGQAGATLEAFKDMYSDEDAIMSLFSNAPVMRKWIEDGGDCKDLWWSKVVSTYLPAASSNEMRSMDYIFNDLTYCKNQGWFKKFGL